jgi:hydrogenase expression/formation protein HypE
MDNGYKLKAVLFDFDGTLTRPGVLDFEAIRQAIGCPPGSPILEYIAALADPDEHKSAMDTLDRFEIQAAAQSGPNQGAEDLMAWIKQNGLALGILTRNSRASVLRALGNFSRIREQDVDLIITREDPVAPKPSGDGVLRFADQMGIEPQEVLVVGDFLFDTQAGREAGSPSVLLDPGQDPRLVHAACDFRVRCLEQIRPIIAACLPLAAGKLPNDMLRTYLGQFRFEDPSVIINPGVGEDIAAVDIRDKDVLILKSDPITFATDAIGRYSVLVNAIDIATAGAVPRWFLTTLLLPPGISPSQVRKIMQELWDVCSRWQITLCGGHTEITDAVNRPVVIGMMAGCVRRQDLIDKKQMKTGDCVLVSKGVAVEGTAIIAREFGQRLASLGITAQELSRGRSLLDRISILPEAGLAARDMLATAMHDVTEGGLATALEELSIAGNHRIAVDMDKIPILALTRKICDKLCLDPLGLIGSGSLLICCRRQDCQRLVRRMAREGIEVTRIGEVIGPGTGIEARNQGKPADWPRFEVDEITKLF